MADRYPFSRSDFTLQSRITVGRINSVDEQNSIMTVEATDTCDTGLPVSLPFGGLTAQEGNPTAWIRYMPRAGDFVVYARDNRGLAYPLSFVPYNLAGPPTTSASDTAGTKGGSSGSNYGQNSWSPGTAKAHALHKAGTVAGFEQWAVLRAGEWDMKSSGGAYLHGSKGGTLTLSGGGASNWILSKKRTEISGSTELMKVAGGENCAFRYGSVKRQGPLDTSPALVSLAPLPDPREWYVKLGNASTAAAIPGLVPAAAAITYEEKAGDIWSEDIPGALGKTIAAGTLQLSGMGQPLRYMRAVHGLGSTLPAFQAAPGSLANKQTIDAMGNIDIEHGPATTSVSFGPPAGVPSTAAVSMSALSLGLNTATSITAEATTNVRIDGAAGIQFGGAATAIEPVVLGLKLQTALVTFATTMSGIFSAMSTTPTAVGPVTAAGPGVAACAALNTALASILSAKVRTE